MVTNTRPGGVAVLDRPTNPINESGIPPLTYPPGEGISGGSTADPRGRSILVAMESGQERSDVTYLLHSRRYPVDVAATVDDALAYIRNSEDRKHGLAILDAAFLSDRGLEGRVQQLVSASLGKGIPLLCLADSNGGALSSYVHLLHKPYTPGDLAAAVIRYYRS